MAGVKGQPLFAQVPRPQLVGQGGHRLFEALQPDAEVAQQVDGLQIEVLPEVALQGQQVGPQAEIALAEGYDVKALVDEELSRGSQVKGQVVEGGREGRGVLQRQGGVLGQGLDLEEKDQAEAADLLAPGFSEELAAEPGLQHLAPPQGQAEAAAHLPVDL